MTELSNLYFFAWMLAKVSLLCGFLPGIAIAILCDQVRGFGFETVSVKVSGRAVSRGKIGLQHGNKPARDVRRYA